MDQEETPEEIKEVLDRLEQIIRSQLWTGIGNILNSDGLVSVEVTFVNGQAHIERVDTNPADDNWLQESWNMPAYEKPTR